MNMSEDAFDWPSRGQRLFLSKPPQKGKKARADAADPLRSDEFLAMINHRRDLASREGWYHAADNLARDIIHQKALKKLDSDRECFGVFLPMLYCYRHYLEVALKHLIEQLDRLSTLDTKVDLQREHGLKQLWNGAKLLAYDVFRWPDPIRDAPDKDVERLLNEFHEFDPTSQTFRYRRDRQERPHDESIPNADLHNLIAVMHGLFNYFSAWEDRIWELEQSLPDSSDCCDEW